MRDTERGFKLSVPLSVPPFLGGGGGGFYSSGRSGMIFDGSIGDRGEGGMGFLQGGVGGRAKTNNIMGGWWWSLWERKIGWGRGRRVL